MGFMDDAKKKITENGDKIQAKAREGFEQANAKFDSWQAKQEQERANRERDSLNK
jgi:hypothetical protein